MNGDRYYSKFGLGGALLLVLCLAGCRGNPGRTSVKDGYLLNIQRPGVELKLKWPVEVRQCKAAAAFAARNLLYRISPVQYEVDRFNTLIVPMDQQLTEAMQRWFRCDTEQESSEPRNGHLVVEATLDELVGDFVNRTEPKAHVQIHFVVTFRQGRIRQPVLDQVYSAGVSMHPSPTAGQVVTAMSRGVEQVLQQFEADLVKSQQYTK